MNPVTLQEAAERRGEMPGQIPLEFVWGLCRYERDGKSSVHRHRIIRQTEKLVAVDTRRFDEKEWARLCRYVVQHGWWTLTSLEIKSVNIMRASLDRPEGVACTGFECHDRVFATEAQAWEYDRRGALGKRRRRNGFAGSVVATSFVAPMRHYPCSV